MSPQPEHDVLTAEVVELFDRAVLCWLATADADGAPNVSPKEIFAVAPGDRIVIADIASPKTVRNIGATPRVCIAAIDIFEQRGFQLYGDAEVITPDDDRFAQVSPPLLTQIGGAFTLRGVIEVRVDRLSKIVAPSYWARPEQTDASRRESAYAAYGVAPIAG